MKSSLAILVVLVAAASAVPRTPRDTKEEATTPLTDFLKTAQESINEIGEQIKKELNLPDQETVVNTLKNQSNTFVNNLKDYITKTSEEVKAKSPEIEKVWGDVKTKLNKVADDINAQVPNAKEQAAVLQSKLQEGFQTLLTESEKISKTLNENTGVVQENVAKFTKQAVNLAVETTKDLNAKLKEAAQATAKN